MPTFIVAQQDVQYTQFMHNRMALNPGAAGSSGAICFTSAYRSQWVGFEGAPVTLNANASVPIGKYGGVGLSITSDQIGFYENTGLDLMYAYQIRLSSGTIGLGAGVSLLNGTIVSADWIPSDENTNILANLDPSLTPSNANGLNVDYIFGVYYNSETFWGGISSTRLIESSTQVSGSTNSYFRNSRHYYAMGGYNWAIPGSNWELQPAAIFKLSSGMSNTFDINVTGVLNKKIWGGVTYRVNDAIGTIIGYQIMPSLKAGYSYDITTSELSSASGGSHEIMLQYCLKIEIPPPAKGSYRNPRFL